MLYPNCNTVIIRLVIVLFGNICSSIILFSIINFDENIVFSLITNDILCKKNTIGYH